MARYIVVYEVHMNGKMIGSYDREYSGHSIPYERLLADKVEAMGLSMDTLNNQDEDIESLVVPTVLASTEWTSREPRLGSHRTITAS